MSNPNTIRFDYTCKYYELLKEASESEEIDGVQVPVFRGSVTSVFRSMSISQSYYSSIKKALETLGCISVMRQGSRNVPTVIVLHHEPTAEAWEEYSDQDLTTRLDAVILTQRVNDILDSIGGLNVKKAIADLAKEVDSLKREVERLGKTPTARRRSAG